MAIILATGYNPRQSRRSISACVGWAKQEADSHRLYAETADGTQPDTQASHVLADGTAATCLTVKTVTDPAIHRVALPQWRDAEQSCGQLDRTTRLLGHQPDSHRHTICIVTTPVFRLKGINDLESTNQAIQHLLGFYDP